MGPGRRGAVFLQGWDVLGRGGEGARKEAGRSCLGIQAKGTKGHESTWLGVIGTVSYESYALPYGGEVVSPSLRFPICTLGLTATTSISKLGED